MTIAELRNLMRQAFPQATVLSAVHNDGRRHGDDAYDLPDSPALDMRLEELGSTLKANGWRFLPPNGG